MRSPVSLPRVPSGIWPEREEPGRRRTVMVLSLQPTPGHEQTEAEVFHAREGRTAALKARSAWVSPARSPLMTGARSERRERMTR